jgi:phosphate/sulfate permease
MRIAVLIIGLLLGLLVFLQSMVVNVGSGIAKNDNLENAAAAGVFLAFFWLIASALVIPFPLASAILFVLGGIMGMIAAGNSEFDDLWIWGCVSFVLAIMSFFGWRGKRKDAREKLAALTRQQDHERRIEALLARDRVVQPVPERYIVCTSCGHHNAPGTRYCAECGSPMRATAAS